MLSLVRHNGRRRPPLSDETTDFSLFPFFFAGAGRAGVFLAFVADDLFTSFPFPTIR